MKTTAAKLDLEHLSGAVKEAALLPNAERKLLIKRDRWIGYPKATQVLAALHEAVATPTRQRMGNIMLIGPTNNGKSKIIQKLVQQCTPTVQPADRTCTPVLSLEMPPEPSSNRLYAAILNTLNAPVKSHARTVDLEFLAIKEMREVEVRAFVIDEIHNLLSGTARQQRVVLNQLKYLGNQLRVPIIGVGTGDAWHAIKNDSQLANRFQPLTLPLWELDPDFLSLLVSFGKMFPLRERSYLADERTAELVLNRTDRSIGEITALLEAAAIRAIDEGEERLCYDVIAETAYQSPNERRMHLDMVIR